MLHVLLHLLETPSDLLFRPCEFRLSHLKCPVGNPSVVLTVLHDSLLIQDKYLHLFYQSFHVSLALFREKVEAFRDLRLDIA